VGLAALLWLRRLVTPPQKCGFEEQPLRMNLFSPAFFPSVLRFYAGNLQNR